MKMDAFKKLSIVALFALAGGVAAQAQQDTIPLRDGKTQQGKIMSEDYSGIVLQLAQKATTTIKLSDVDESQPIKYNPVPKEFETARNALDNGKVDEALMLLPTLAEDKKLRPVLRQHVLYDLARAQRMKGDADAALAALAQLRDEFPKGRYAVDGARLAVDCALDKSDTKTALAALDQAAAAGKKEGLADDFAARIAVLRGQTYEKIDPARAAAEYKSAAGMAGADAALKLEIDLGNANVALKSGKGADAEPLLRNVVKSDAAGVVLAAAWNGLGDVLSEQGMSTRNVDKLLEAAFAYLRSVVQYRPKAGESAYELERGLKGASEAFKHCAELETKPETKKRYQDLAARQLAELKKQFP